MAAKRLDLEDTGAWLQARLGRNVWLSITAGEARAVLTGQGQLRYEPGHLDVQQWTAQEAENQRRDWHLALMFQVGPSFRLYLGDNFLGAIDDAGVLRIELDKAEVTITDDFWALFRRDAER
jgi:hypothetical protein